MYCLIDFNRVIIFSDDLLHACGLGIQFIHIMDFFPIDVNFKIIIGFTEVISFKSKRVIVKLL